MSMQYYIVEKYWFPFFRKYNIVIMHNLSDCRASYLANISSNRYRRLSVMHCWNKIFIFGQNLKCCPYASFTAEQKGYWSLNVNKIMLSRPGNPGHQGPLLTMVSWTSSGLKIRLSKYIKLTVGLLLYIHVQTSVVFEYSPLKDKFWMCKCIQHKME